MSDNEFLPKHQRPPTDRRRPLVRAVVPPVLSAAFDPALRRVASADGHDPWARPPAIDGAPRLEEVRTSRRRRHRLAWNERFLEAAGPHQVRLTVPLLGAYPPSDFGYRVGLVLQGAWIGRASGGVPPVTAVAVHVRHARGQRCLLVLMTLDPGQSAGRLDGPAVARALDDAVVLCGDEDAAVGSSAPRSRLGPLRTVRPRR